MAAHTHIHHTGLDQRMCHHSRQVLLVYQPHKAHVNKLQEQCCALKTQSILIILASGNALCRGLPSADPEARCSSMASLTSCSRCPESLEADPSTPMPTFTLASSSFLTGAMPALKFSCRLVEHSCESSQCELFIKHVKQGITHDRQQWHLLMALVAAHVSPEARRRLEEGQCETPIPLSANCCISLSSSIQQWANQTSGPSHSTLLQSTLSWLNMTVVCSILCGQGTHATVTSSMSSATCIRHLLRLSLSS